MAATGVRFHLLSLLECCAAGCQATGKDPNAFGAMTAASAAVTSSHDTALSNSICTFLTNGKNWDAIKALDFARFEAHGGGGLRIGESVDAVLDVAGLLSALSSHPKEFCACWRALIELCHCVLPAERHFTEQLTYLCSNAALQCTTTTPGNGLDEILGNLLNNGDLVNGLINGTADVSQIDANKIVTGVHRAVEPLIEKLEDGATKQGIQMIVRGLMSLAQQAAPQGGETPR